MKDSYFVQRFESLRGIAAIMVAASHSLMIFRLSGHQAETGRVLSFLCNGWAAVTLFFVLSGFVLGLAIRRADAGFTTDFLRYAVRRLFRIYPAFLCSTVLILAWLFLGAKLFPNISHWMDQPALSYKTEMLNSHMSPTWSSVLSNLCMLDSSINLVTWTLKVEMGCSLLLALLHYLVRGMSRSGKTLMLLGLIVLACLGKWLLLLGYVRAEAVFDGTILKYIFLFYLGYLLPEAGPLCFEKLRTHVGLNALVLSSATALFFASNALSLGAFQDDLRIVQGGATWIILASILYGAQFACLKMLDQPLVVFYGRISYSFYLLHDLGLIVLSRFFAFAVPETIWGRSPFLFMFLLWGVSTATITCLAWASYSFIERPFIHFSRNICSRLSISKRIYGKNTPSPETEPMAC